jgi:hypothetical protein
VFQFRGSLGCFGEQQATKVDLIINLKADVKATLLDDRIGSNRRVRSLSSERSLLALSARNAYGRFLVFTVRTRLVGKGSNGSRLCKNFRAFSHGPISFAFTGP